MQQHNSICNFGSSESWVILSPIEQSIKRKIEAVGTPLKDWDIQINYGIKTGFNDAFIISTEKRNEILENCKDPDERKRTEELIRPILRGRDLKRYSYEWANLWLINTHNGVKGKYPPIDINDYPAIKQHLDLYWNKISKRDDKGITPYNLRNCAYLDDFSKPKIVWSRLMRLSKSDLNSFPRFCVVPEQFMVIDSLCFFTGFDMDMLVQELNSEFAEYYFFNSVATLDNGGFQMRQQYIEEIPLPKLRHSNELNDESIYDMFGFTKEEIDFIKNSIKQRKEEITNTIK